MPVYFEDDRSITIHFEIRPDFPLWSVIHFLQQTTSNHMKVLQTKLIVQLFEQGAHDDQFLVGEQSIELYPEKRLILRGYEYTKLESKRDSVIRFWNIIRTHIRPIVFFKPNDEWLPLYDFTSSYALSLKQYQTKSPPRITLEGAGSSIVDLIFASRREKRLEEEWVISKIYKSAENVERIVSAAEIIHRSDAPLGIKRYAEEILNNLIVKQAELNDVINVKNRLVGENAEA